MATSGYELITESTWDRFWSKTLPSKGGCWEYTGKIERNGYGRIAVVKDGKRKDIGAHRLAYMLGRGEGPGDLCVCHTCDNRRCVNPAHLFLGSILDNVRDMDAKGRRKPLRGEQHGRSKLTESDVLDIRSKASLGTSQADLSRQYAVSPMLISKIVRRKLWREV